MPLRTSLSTTAIVSGSPPSSFTAAAGLSLST